MVRKSEPRLDAEPLEAAGKRVGAIVDLKHAASRVDARPFGCMKDRRGVSPYVARLGEAGVLDMGGGGGGDVSFGNRTKAMTAERDQQRSIILGHLIQVDAQRDHAVEQLEGRRDMLHRVLHRPWAETRQLDPSPHRDGAILMPSQCPICSWSLVEQDGAHGTRFRSENLRGNGTDRGVGSKQSGKPGKIMKADAGFPCRKGGDGADDVWEKRQGGAVEALGAILAQCGPLVQRYSSAVAFSDSWWVMSQWSGVTVTQPSVAASRSVLCAGVCGMPASLIQ